MLSDDEEEATYTMLTRDHDTIEIHNESDLEESVLHEAVERSQIVFGTKEFVIKHDFKTLTSDLRNSYFYTLYGDLELRNKVSCLVPNMQLMTPTKMEIWLLEEPPNMFFNNKLNES